MRRLITDDMEGKNIWITYSDRQSNKLKVLRFDGNYALFLDVQRRHEYWGPRDFQDPETRVEVAG